MNTTGKTIIIFALLFSALAAYSQCNTFLQKANAFFAEKKYADAKQQYLNYKECKTNAPASIDDKIAECDRLLKVKSTTKTASDYYIIGEDVFFADFTSPDDANANLWQPIYAKDYMIYNKSGEGLLIASKKNQPIFSDTVSVSVSVSEPFIIETEVDFIDGCTSCDYGLIWNRGDDNNFSYFFITADGYYTIVTKKNGVQSSRLRKEMDAINQNHKQSNVLRIEVTDKIQFKINGKLAHISKFNEFVVYNIGFYVSGNIEVAFKSLYIKVKHEYRR